MAKTISTKNATFTPEGTDAPVIKAKNNAVDVLILAAGKAAGTMYSKAKEAAKEAAKELDAALPLGERLAIVMTAHADAFKTAGHNVKAIFSDALTLYACPDDDVTVPALDKKSSAIATASHAVELSKHVMRAAAKEVRDTHGLGRKTAPKSEVLAKPSAANVEADFAGLLLSIGDVLKNPELTAKLIAFLGVAGYIVAPKVKTKAYTTTADTPVKAPKAKTMSDIASVYVRGAAAH